MTTECPHCGSTDIVKNITVSQAVETGLAGLQYKTRLVLTGTEPLLTDLCHKCGTVVRFHVKNSGRKWQTRT